MATKLIDRVAHRLGQSAAADTNFPTKAMIVNSLNEGAKEVVRNITPFAIPEHIQESTASASKTNGLAIPSDYIKDIQVYRYSNNYNLRRVPAYMRFLLKDSNSMHYATLSDPAYYFKKSRIFVEPAVSASSVSFTIVYLAEPPACSSTTNESYASWNRDVEELAIDYSVIRSKESQIGDYNERYKTSLALAKTRAVSAVSTIGGYSFSVSNFVSAVSSLDSVLPLTTAISVSTLVQTISISSVSWPTTPSISMVGIPSLNSVSFSTTRFTALLNSASYAVSLMGGQITAEDFEKGKEYITKAQNHLQVLSGELNKEREKISTYTSQYNKAIGQYQIEVNKYLQYFGNKLDRASRQSDFDKGKFDSQHQYNIQYWQAKVTRGIEKINSQVNRYNSWVNEESTKNRLLLEKASARLQASNSELQIASIYIQNSATQLGEIKALEEKFRNRIAEINVRFSGAG